MPRNSGTGVYSPPPNITAVSGAPIESADWNAKIQDDTTMFNTPVPVGLGGTGVTSLTGFLATIGGLPLAGGTLTGPLTLSGDATASLQPVTKQQFDTGLSGKANTTVTDALSSGKQATLVSGANIKTVNGATILSAGNISTAPDLIVEDQKPPGTNGGTSVAGAQSRTLNTVVRNTFGGTPLSSNFVTLGPGEYYVEYSAPAQSLNNHKAAWRNVTDNTYVSYGSNAYVNGSFLIQTDSTGVAYFTITAPKTFDLRHFTETAGGTETLGRAFNFGAGVVEVYSRVKIWKLA